ncbi:MAG: glycoside hydrolase family 5 protein, partial [Myxococcota bacterium]|nr:glycoside hydrolase family 5 protein [Myxococcota bacterium]
MRATIICGLLCWTTFGCGGANAAGLSDWLQDAGGSSSGSGGGGSSSSSSSGASPNAARANDASGASAADAPTTMKDSGSIDDAIATAPTPAPTLFPVLPYRGVSLAGAEFAASTGGTFGGKTLGTIPNDYYYPDSLVPNAGMYAGGYAHMAYPYYRGKGMNTFRMPFRWERLQRALTSSFDAGELAAFQTAVADMVAAGATVLLDAHNYGRYASASQIASGANADMLGSGALPNSAFADFWKRLATLYKNNGHVVFDLMNEPNGLNTNQTWPDAAQAAVTAIRSVGANNLILIEGNAWADAKTWPTVSDTLKNISDPANNMAFEVHVYPDVSGGGGSDTCSDVNSAVTQLQPFTAWLKANHARGFLGEFSAGISIRASAQCMQAIDNELKHLAANPDVYIGWTYWAGGAG